MLSSALGTGHFAESLILNTCAMCCRLLPDGEGRAETDTLLEGFNNRAASLDTLVMRLVEAVGRDAFVACCYPSPPKVCAPATPSLSRPASSAYQRTCTLYLCMLLHC